MQIAHNTGQLLLRTAAQFGLTPSAERRQGSITPPDDNEHSPYDIG